MDAVRRMLLKCGVDVPASAARMMDECLYEGDYWWLGAGEDAAARKLERKGEGWALARAKSQASAGLEATKHGADVARTGASASPAAAASLRRRVFSPALPIVLAQLGSAQLS